MMMMMMMMMMMSLPRKPVVSRHHFHRSYLKASGVLVKVKIQGKLNVHIISEGVMLMLLTEIYQNWSTFVEATACQIWRVFLRHSILLVWLWV